MESCLLSRTTESYHGGASSDHPHQNLMDTTNLPLMFPTTPSIKINDILSSILQYNKAAELCSSSLIKTEPASPLYSPNPKKMSLSTYTPSSDHQSGIMSMPSSSGAFSAPSVTSCSSIPPYSSADNPTPLLVAPRPEGVPFPRPEGVPFPRSNILQNAGRSLLSPLLPNTALLAPSLSTNTSSFLPTTTGSLLQSSSSSSSSALFSTASILNSNQLLANKLTDSKIKPDQCCKVIGAPGTGTSPNGVSNAVKIFQTKQGYTLLICNGYRYSKISTSSNGKKVYWRCTLRSCKGKVHTDVGGGVVYESTHDHPPMAEEFLFSCHSNRLAKEARQIMRFDPMKAIKEEIPYSALEYTPTFCKIKDRLNIKKGSSTAAVSDHGTVPAVKSESGSPLQKHHFPVTSPTLPSLNLEHSSEGSITVQTTTCELLQELNALRLTHHLCDVALCVNGTLIYAHRVVLAAASQYFRLLFLSNTKILSYIELRGVDAESVELLVNFAYTGSLNINYTRVTEMLAAANLLHFTPVVDRCCEYLRSKITPRNCIKMRELVAIQGLAKLQAVLDRYICSNWSKVLEQDEVYDARPETLLFFLGQDDLIVSSETEVYQVIIRWVRRSPLYRQFYVVELLKKVRLVQLNAQFLVDNIESEELVRQHRECETLLHQAKNHFLLPERDHGLDPYYFRKRKRRHNVCLVGTDSNRTIAYEYDVIRGSAWEVASTDLSRTQYCLVNAGADLCVVGGISPGGVHSGQITCLNTHTNLWSNSSCSLSHPRAKASAVSDGSGIYVIGGEGASGPSDKVEHMDFTTSTVTTLPPLPHGVSGAATCIVGDNIIIFGGRTSCGLSDQVHVYNKPLRTWKTVSSLPEKVEEAAAVVNVDEMIYLVTSSSRQYRYNPILDVWDTPTTSTTTAPTTPATQLLASTTVDGDLFAIRRSDAGKLTLDRLEGATLSWSSCCSVDVPLNVQAISSKPTSP